MVRVDSLREVLRDSTRELHDALDGMLAPLADGDRYSEFLAIQHAARLPIEDWFDAESDVLSPPSQTGLIATDLATLRVGPSRNSPRFCPQSSAEAIGIAWVLAGSSLGNRVILRRRKAFDGGTATCFLADDAMPSFWNALRPRLERPANERDAKCALAGARRTFEHFLSVAGDNTSKLAA